MRTIELFAGVGGFRLGLERNGHEVIWANEWDKYACDTYDKNFSVCQSCRMGRNEQADIRLPVGQEAVNSSGVDISQAERSDRQPLNGSRSENNNDGVCPHAHRIDRRDITTIPAGDIPPHDLICGGFPCQAFSIAGKRRGFEETRGTLFFDILRLARHHRTPYLLLENVKGLLNHDGGRTFDTIIRALDESGYDCQWQVLNSKDFGVPQNRERVYIVGHLRGQPRSEVFPLIPADSQNIEQLNADVAQDYRVYATSGIAPTLNPAAAAGGAVIPKIVQLNDPVRASDRIYGENGLGPTLNTMQGGRRQPMVAKTVRSGGGNSPHGAKQNWDSYEIEGRIRRLTPMECERLQGFPDNWTAGVSDTQRYKQMGNAVTVNVVQAVASKLLTDIQRGFTT